jgi:hypothetical protein
MYKPLGSEKPELPWLDHGIQIFLAIHSDLMDIAVKPRSFMGIVHGLHLRFASEAPELPWLDHGIQIFLATHPDLMGTAVKPR